MEKISLKKDINDYSLYIFDLDGTLYYQKPFRIRMALYLMTYILTHPFSLKDVLIIKKYREIREKWDIISDNSLGNNGKEKSDDFENDDNQVSLDMQQYSYVASKMSVSAERVEKAVNFFMLKAPLSLLPNYTDEILKQYINKLKSENKKIVIYSDYPVEDKIKALGISAESYYTSSDENIGIMKPDGKGIQVILSENNISAADAVMIGDRYEKDGLCAKANNVDYLILSSSKKERNITYRDLKITS